MSFTYSLQGQGQRNDQSSLAPPSPQHPWILGRASSGTSQAFFSYSSTYDPTQHCQTHPHKGHLPHTTPCSKIFNTSPSSTELRATFSVWSFLMAQCGFPAIPLVHSQPILLVPAELDYHWYSHQGPLSSFVSSVPEIPSLLPPAQVLLSCSTPQTCWNLPNFNYPFL